MGLIWVPRTVVIRVDGSQFPSSQQQHSLGVPGAWFRVWDPHGRSGCLAQRNPASDRIVAAVEGFLHVNVLHDRRTVFDTRRIFKFLRRARYLIVMLRGSLVWSAATYLNPC